MGISASNQLWARANEMMPGLYGFMFKGAKPVIIANYLLRYNSQSGNYAKKWLTGFVVANSNLIDIDIFRDPEILHWAKTANVRTLPDHVLDLVSFIDDLEPLPAIQLAFFGSKLVKDVDHIDFFGQFLR